MFAKVTNGNVDQFPYTIGQLRRDNPTTSFPKSPSEELLSSYGVVSVVLRDMPSVDGRTQKAEQDKQPTLVSGVWTLDWSVVYKTEEEIAEQDLQKAKSVRAVRDAKLADTDWVVIKAMETGTAVPEAIATERQALRDITAQEGFPWTITWPEMP